MPDMNNKYISVIKEKLSEKKMLRKLRQTKKCPVLKTKLNRTFKALKKPVGKKSRYTRISKKVKFS